MQGKSQATTVAVTCEDDALAQQAVKGCDQKLNTTVMSREHENYESDRRAERSFKRSCCQALAKERTHDLDVNFNGNREGTGEPRHENSGHVGRYS